MKSIFVQVHRRAKMEDVVAKVNVNMIMFYNLHCSSFLPVFLLLRCTGEPRWKTSLPR